jgi:hypothetical protein
MGRVAQSAWILAFLPFLGRRCCRALASASASPRALRLNASAGCSNGNLDITLTTVGAHREGLAGDRCRRLDDFAKARIQAGCSPTSAARSSASRSCSRRAQAAAARSASYAYVGERPPPRAIRRVLRLLPLHDARDAAVVLRSLRHVPADRAAGACVAGPRIPAAGPAVRCDVTALVAGQAVRSFRRR